MTKHITENTRKLPISHLSVGGKSLSKKASGVLESLCIRTVGEFLGFMEEMEKHKRCYFSDSVVKELKQAVKEI